MRLTLLSACLAAGIAVPGNVSAEELAKPKLVLQEKVEGMPTAKSQEVRVFTATFKPGSQTPLHTHRFPVTVYILEGALTFEMEGHDAKVVKAGESMVEPPGTKMTGNNKGKEPSKAVIFYVSDPDTPFLDPASK